MRLVCPNCDAQYEVDDAAIPDAGRDVQCSNCGHAWFQRSPRVEAEQEVEDEIFLSDDEVAVQPEPPPPPVPEPVVDASPADLPDEDETPPAPPPAPADEALSPKRALDESLLAVLREEAEREEAVRAAEAPPEAAPPAAKAAPAAAAPPPVPPSVLAARERFADLSVDSAPEDEDEVVIRPASRRELLPDIEEINSTLRATSEPRVTDDDVAVPPVIVSDPRSGFRSGFVLMLLVSVGLWMAYVMAPRIATQIPASASAMDAYVAVVDKARVSVDAALQSASQSLRSLSGQDG